MDQIKERCIYCGSDVYYTGTEVLIKCGMCGHTLVVAKFENEQAKMKAALEEGEEAKKDLAEAEKARRDAEVRLQEAVESLSGIKDGQDVLSIMMRSVMAGQDTASDELTKLQDISARILKGQGNLFEGMSILGEIKDQLGRIGLDEQAQNNFAREFVNWFQDIHNEDIARLEKTVSQSSQLLEEQKEINDKIDQLSQVADRTQKTLDEFHSQWKESQLKELQQLYHQAENLQQDRMFDKAEQYYRQVLVKGGDDPEVYWRLLMCHYCLTYQTNDEGELIPIILNPDLTAPEEMSLRRDFAIQMKNISTEQKAVYENELIKIDRILDSYREVRHDWQFDVFISVKQSKDDHYTSDSDTASDLYDFLSGRGLKVFNSRRTKLPLGKEYEPYIISALLSSKVLIVVGSTSENMEAQWVKNEWSRFQWLQYYEKKQTGKTGRVLLCYLTNGMKPHDIPRALNPERQAICDGVKAHDELLEGLAFLNKTVEKPVKAGTNNAQMPITDYSQVERQMKLWLLQGKYGKVQERYDQLTDEGIYLEYASLHLAALCAKQQVHDIQMIVDSEMVLDQAVEFKAAIMFCQDDEEKSNLENLAKQNRIYREKNENTKNAEIAKWYDSGEEAYNKKAYKEAAVFFQKAAGAGYEAAQYRLGMCYDVGSGVPINKKEAVNWYRKAAEAGYTDAQYQLGNCYYNENGLGWDEKEEKKWYGLAAEGYLKNAESGNVDAMFKLGEIYYKGPQFISDIDEAEKWYRKAAEAGCTEAQYQLGYLFAFDNGVSKDEEESNKWIKLAAEGYLKMAQGGNIEAMYKLGEINESGCGGLNDITEAMKWYRMAGEEDHIEAQYRLGVYYLFSTNDKPEEKQEGQKWIRRAIRNYERCAEGGDTNAMLDLGDIYANGIVVPLDMKKAAGYFKQSAEQGNFNGMYQYAILLAEGNGTDRNDEEAAFWLKKCAENGLKEAQFDLASCFESGVGVKKNYNEALKWYRKSAEQGKKEADEKIKFIEREIAVCGSETLENRFGLEEEIFQALAKIAIPDFKISELLSGNYSHEQMDAIEEVYRKYKTSSARECYLNGFSDYRKGDYVSAFNNHAIAAAKGYVYSQYMLGWLYDYGQGTEQNCESAMYWYDKAAKQGHAKANAKLKELKEKLDASSK